MEKKLLCQLCHNVHVTMCMTQSTNAFVQKNTYFAFV